MVQAQKPAEEGAMSISDWMGKSVPDVARELGVSQGMVRMYGFQNQLKGKTGLPKDTTDFLRAECGYAVTAWEELDAYCKNLNPDSVTKKQFEKMKSLYNDAMRLSYLFAAKYEAIKAFYDSYNRAEENFKDAKAAFTEMAKQLREMEYDDKRRHLVANPVYAQKLAQLKEADAEFEGAKKKLRDLEEKGAAGWFQSSAEGTQITPEFSQAMGAAQFYANFDFDNYRKIFMLDVGAPLFRSKDKALAFINETYARLKAEENASINFSVVALGYRGKHIFNPDGSLATENYLSQEAKDKISGEYAKAYSALGNARRAIENGNSPDLKFVQASLAEARNIAGTEISAYYHLKQDVAMKSVSLAIMAGCTAGGALLGGWAGAGYGMGVGIAITQGGEGIIDYSVGSQIHNPELQRQGLYKMAFGTFALVAAPLARAGAAANLLELQLTVAGVGAYFGAEIAKDFAKTASSAWNYGLDKEKALTIATDAFMLAAMAVFAAEGVRSRMAAKPVRVEEQGVGSLVPKKVAVQPLQNVSLAEVGEQFLQPDVNIYSRVRVGNQRMTAGDALAYLRGQALDPSSPVNVNAKTVLGDIASGAADAKVRSFAEKYFVEANGQSFKSTSVPNSPHAESGASGEPMTFRARARDAVQRARDGIADTGRRFIEDEGGHLIPRQRGDPVSGPLRVSDIMREQPEAKKLLFGEAASKYNLSRPFNRLSQGPRPYYDMLSELSNLLVERYNQVNDIINGPNATAEVKEVGARVMKLLAERIAQVENVRYSRGLLRDGATNKNVDLRAVRKLVKDGYNELNQSADINDDLNPDVRRFMNDPRYANLLGQNGTEELFDLLFLERNLNRVFSGSAEKITAGTETATCIPVEITAEITSLRFAISRMRGDPRGLDPILDEVSTRLNALENEYRFESPDIIRRLRSLRLALSDRARTFREIQTEAEGVVNIPEVPRGGETRPAEEYPFPEHEAVGTQIYPNPLLPQQGKPEPYPTYTTGKARRVVGTLGRTAALYIAPAALALYGIVLVTTSHPIDRIEALGRGVEYSQLDGAKALDSARDKIISRADPAQLAGIKALVGGVNDAQLLAMLNGAFEKLEADKDSLGDARLKSFFLNYLVSSKENPETKIRNVIEWQKNAHAWDSLYRLVKDRDINYDQVLKIFRTYSMMIPEFASEKEFLTMQKRADALLPGLTEKGMPDMEVSDYVTTLKNLDKVRKAYEQTRDWQDYKSRTAGADAEARFRVRFNEILPFAHSRIKSLELMADSSQNVKAAFDSGANTLGVADVRDQLMAPRKMVPDAEYNYGFKAAGSEYQLVSTEVLTRFSNVKIKTGDFPALLPAQVSATLGKLVCNFEGGEGVLGTKDAIEANRQYLADDRKLTLDSPNKDLLAVGYPLGSSDPQEFAAWYARHLEASSYSGGTTFNVSRFNRGLIPELYQVDLLVGELSADARTRGENGIFEYLLASDAEPAACLETAKQIRRILESQNLLGEDKRAAREEYFRNTIVPLFGDAGVNADALKSLVK